jgi:hypothetical protein
VSDYSWPRPELLGARHLRRHRRSRQNSPQLTSGPVAEHGTRATGENRPHPTPLHSQRLVADRVDPTVNRMQPSLTQPPINSPPPHPNPKQLPPSHYALLAVGERRDRSIHIARPAFAPYDVVNAGLVRHRRIVPARNARGARALSILWVESIATGARKRGPSPPLPPLALIPSSEGGCLLPIPRDRETIGSRAVCVGSNGETALVRTRASAQPYHRGRLPRASS